MLKICYILGNGNSESESAIIKPTYKKRKSNPNIQSTSSKKNKDNAQVDNSGSDSDSVMVSYKSKKSAMPAGPSDQGATAILVCIIFVFILPAGNWFAKLVMVGW